MPEQEKVKTAADGALIVKLFSFQPISWARYPDGTLSFISPTGQKYSYAHEDLERMQATLKAEAAAKKKPAAIAAAKKPAPAAKSTKKTAAK